MKSPAIGDSVRRTEDLRFLTGRGRYIDDITLPNQAYAAVVRSPHAHARINGIDAKAALAIPGVLLVVTAEDWKREGFGPIPTKSAVNKKRDGTPLNEPPRHCLAMDKARHVGEAVALVVAETANIALDALDVIEVDYEPLPAVTTAEAALAPGAPLVWDDIPGNFCIDFQLGDREATEAALAAADHVVELDIVNNRVTAVPIEPRGAIASYDKATDSYTLYNATQNVHANRDQFAEKVLKIDKSKIHHIAPDVGGGFGVKNGVYPEPALLMYAAKRLERPVKWINTRSESFVSDTHGRNQLSHVKLGIDKDGTFRALYTETIGDLGAYCWTVGPFTPTGGSARTQGGPYGFKAMYYCSKAAFTNTMCMDPYRGAGRPEASFQIERIVEYAARTLGLDPVEVRRKNLIPPTKLPMKTAMGLDVDCGDFPRVFERTLQLSDRAGFAKRAEESRKKGWCRGFAIAPYMECTGGGPKEFAGVRFSKDGSVELAVGSQSTGMGHETSMPQILAANLGIAFDSIQYRQGDTDATPLGGGHGGSRNLELGGNAVLQAAKEVIEKGKAIAAHLFETDAAKVEFKDGAFLEPGTNHTMTMRDVIDASFDPAKLPDGMAPGGLDANTTFERGVISIPNGCHAAEVEVGPATGTVRLVGYWVVDDFGTIINPLLCDGQVMGGVAQGIGQALSEIALYDPDSGQMLTGSLTDYALPRADTIPPMVIEYYEGAPTKKNPLGVKGAGEAGCCGAPPAVVNAVLDALKEFGVIHIDMPLTSEKVWRAIQDAKK
ncbi:MAG TPA: xanthine dehydrogenase family protein molybdopterin-binding subunit [Rhodospirillales bacterium]